ncbi:hypothetical protein [Clostridium tunisiense]|uniref:hypothetical protein n=1 Tax=Clostridium tunisiense TaxID=219748 RepID=UPI00178C3FE1|nr:hypothetical protein [Clostridium tunisiense]
MQFHNQLFYQSKIKILPYKVDVSFGISEYDNNLWKTATELINLADKEMYKSYCKYIQKDVRY